VFPQSKVEVDPNVAPRDAARVRFMVRTAVDSDLAALRALYRRASLSNDGDRDVLLANPDVLVWPQAALVEGRTRVVTDAADLVVGFASTGVCEGALELEDLFVDPECRRRGVASLLVTDVLRTAQGLGIPWVEVTANPHAAAFYASVGFVPVGHERTRFGSGARLRLEVGES
jgi:GNAT superfamily N-acetyltransferase